MPKEQQLCQPTAVWVSPASTSRRVSGWALDGSGPQSLRHPCSCQMELAFESPQLTWSRTGTSCPFWALLRLQICKQDKCCYFKRLSFGVIYYTAEELEYLLNSVIQSVLFFPESTNLTCLAGCKQSQTCYFWIRNFQFRSSFLGHVGHSHFNWPSFRSREGADFFSSLFIIYGKDLFSTPWQFWLLQAFFSHKEMFSSLSWIWHRSLFILKSQHLIVIYLQKKSSLYNFLSPWQEADGSVYILMLFFSCIFICWFKVGGGVCSMFLTSWK